MKSEEKEAQIKAIQDWCLFILDHFIEIIPRDDYKGILHGMRDVVARGAPLTGMRMAQRDINTWAKGLNREFPSNLNERLREKFGRDLISDNLSIEKVIKRVTKRNAIKTREEFELLRNYLDEFLQDEEKKDTISKIGILLDEFNLKKL